MISTSSSDFMLANEEFKKRIHMVGVFVSV